MSGHAYWQRFRGFAGLPCFRGNKFLFNVRSICTYSPFTLQRVYTLAPGRNTSVHVYLFAARFLRYRRLHSFSWLFYCRSIEIYLKISVQGPRLFPSFIRKNSFGIPGGLVLRDFRQSSGSFPDRKVRSGNVSQTSLPLISFSFPASSGRYNNEILWNGVPSTVSSGIYKRRQQEGVNFF